jgi:predicted GTPase
VIGNTSAGKSYMLNVLFGTKLETGMGTTTQTADLALSIGNLHIYDAPGLNEEFEFYEPKTLNLFASMDYIFICYAESVLNNKALISSLSIINKHTIVLVRTKCNQGKAY